MLAFGLTVLGLVRVPHLLVLAALSSTFRAFDEPSRMALVPQLIDRARLANAIALGSIPWQAGRMIGPSITGILIAAFGGTVGFGLAALRLVRRARALQPAAVSVGAHDERRAARRSRQFVEGLSFVGRNFVFASLISLALFNALFGLSYVTLLPVFADSYFGTGSTGYGLLNAAHGAGSLIGTLIIATVAQRILRPGTALLLTAATCMGLALMAFSRSPGDVASRSPMLALVGFCSTFYLTHVSTIIQQKRARPAPRPRAEPLLALLEPAAARRPRGRRAGRGRRRALRGADRRRHGRRQRARAAHLPATARDRLKGSRAYTSDNDGDGGSHHPGGPNMTDGNRNGFRVRAGMRRGFRTEVPLPTRLVSNEEFPPLPQTPAQQAVEHRILADAQRLAPRLGLSRRDSCRRPAAWRRLCWP